MTIAFPVAVPDWASNANYATGPDIATPTKIDPGAAANGFIKGVVAAPQHVNYALNLMTTGYNQHTAAVRRMLQVAALQLRPISNQTANVPADTSAIMAAVQVDPALASSRVLLIKSGTIGVYRAFDNELTSHGTVASITSAVKAAATNGSRVAVIGTGGNLCAYSDDGGDTWTAGAAGIGGAVEHLVWMPPNALSGGGSRFLSGGSGTGSAYRSVNAAVVWGALGSSFPAVLGLAVLGGATANAGYCVCLGASGVQPRFAVLVDGGNGASFNGTQTPPNAATAEEPGSIAGAPLVAGVGSAVYHVMRCNAGARLRTAYTTDGSTWTAAAVIEAPGAAFSAAPRLMLCQSTGLMVIAAALSTGAVALYASVDFVTWLGPTLVRPGAAGLTQFAVAGGRLFMARDALFHGSDGIGY
jgi:hypothetical protein